MVKASLCAVGLTVTPVLKARSAGDGHEPEDISITGSGILHRLRPCSTAAQKVTEKQRTQDKCRRRPAVADMCAMLRHP